MNTAVSLLMTVVVTVYIYYFEIDEDQEKQPLTVVIKSKKKLFFITLIMFAGYALFSGIASYKNGYNGLSLLRNVVFLDSLYLLSLTDAKKHIIPNKIIIADLVIRAFFLVLEVFFVADEPIVALQNTGYGFLISAIAALVLLVLSHGSIGGGDIKLIAIIGLYAGASKAFPVIFISFVLCAMASIVLLISKKRTLKESIPFAPFIFAGMLLYTTLMYLTLNK